MRESRRPAYFYVLSTMESEPKGGPEMPMNLVNFKARGAILACGPVSEKTQRVILGFSD
jgi:hypothetical protein